MLGGQRFGWRRKHDILVDEIGKGATRKDARALGYHGALISHRMEQAKKHGSFVIVASALPSSQSRRNLQRMGLATSHVQALYRRVDS